MRGLIESLSGVKTYNQSFRNMKFFEFQWRKQSNTNQTTLHFIPHCWICLGCFPFQPHFFEFHSHSIQKKFSLHSIILIKLLSKLYSLCYKHLSLSTHEQYIYLYSLIQKHPNLYYS